MAAKRALLVGIDVYPDPQNNLNSCIADTVRFQGLLQSYYGFEAQNITVLHAETGKSGIEVLQQNKDVELVLMDIMMPGMDGYEATRTIRGLPGFGALPIIALTAKAMKGDREKCLQAGASDYVTKPVDLAYLFSVMRVWLARSAGLTAPALAARGGQGDSITLV